MKIEEIITNMKKTGYAFKKEVQEIEDYLNSGVPISEDDKKYLNMRITSSKYAIKRLQERMVKLELLNKFQNSVGNL